MWVDEACFARQFVVHDDLCCDGGFMALTFSCLTFVWDVIHWSLLLLADAVTAWPKDLICLMTCPSSNQLPCHQQTFMQPHSNVSSLKAKSAHQYLPVTCPNCNTQHIKHIFFHLKWCFHWESGTMAIYHVFKCWHGSYVDVMFSRVVLSMLG